MVALSPSAAEILFALGAADRVIALPDLAADLPGARGKTLIGGFSPDLERIVALSPDLLIASRDGTDRKPYERLRSLGFPVLVTGGNTMSGIYEDIRLVGEALGEVGPARDLVDSLRNRVSRAASRLSEAMHGRAIPSVLVVIWPEPPIVAGPASFIGDLLRSAGIPNAVPSSPVEWPRVSFETLAGWNPALLVRPETDENREVFRRAFSSGSPWRVVEAARAMRIVPIPGNWIERPGPRLVDALDRLVDEMVSRTRPTR